MTDIRTKEGREELRELHDADLDPALDGLDIAQETRRGFPLSVGVSARIVRRVASGTSGRALDIYSSVAP